MKTTVDIVRLINALCMCTDCPKDLRLKTRRLCCSMNRLAKYMIMRGEY